ncbi:hypothetical protein HK100_008308 [Physocladia obscura]|uniref:Glycosyl transferase family 1 domain-containing protein n=1 Tax=Physocladia obscura TaxID=109957 RepID=A0AAD5T483_9FUNG|nr:hypothetical protein HK100_008308 [Physocladia obscura]
MQELVDLCHYGGDLHLSRFRAFKSQDFYALVNDYTETCFPLEFSTSGGARSMGHCSDFANYIYYGGARLSMDFGGFPEILDRKMHNCPTTVRVHGEYPNWQFFGMNLTNYWMPNLEQIQVEQMKFFEHIDTVLCKVRAMCVAVERFINAQQTNNTFGIHKFPKFKYMSHSSPDPFEDGPKLLGEEEFKNITQDYNTFYHSYGHSGRKSTQQVFQCWRKHPEWPNLTIVEFPELRRLQLTSGVHLCPSSQEGYGHYINEARAVGAVVLVTDHAPMNEFVEDGISGILVDHYDLTTESYQGMAPYFKSVAPVGEDHICSAVSRVLKLTIEERRQIGQNARKNYLHDKNEMIKNIEELRNEITKKTI